MGRIRSIKPELLDDERTGCLSDRAFRLFVGAILLADDWGGLRAHAVYLGSQVFALSHPKDRDQIAELALFELQVAGLVHLYTVHGQRYASIKGWGKHQKVDKPGKARVPGHDHPEAIEFKLTPESSRDSRETLEKVPETLATDLRPPTSDPEHRTSDQDHHICPVRRDPSPPSAPTVVGGVDQVFEKYREHHPRAKPGEKERRLVMARLREGYSVQDLEHAIDGCHLSPHHCGANDTGTKYQSLELIARDSKHVAQFVEIWERYQTGDIPRPLPRSESGRNLEAARRLVEEALAADAELFTRTERAEPAERERAPPARYQLPDRTSGYERRRPS